MTESNDYKDALSVITLTDDDGSEIDFIVIDGAIMDGVKYMLVVCAEDYDKDEPEAYIIKEIEDDGNEVSFEFVDDDNEYARAAVVLNSEDSDYEMKF